MHWQLERRVWRWNDAKSYGQILGSNDRLNFAVIGLNGRAYAHLSALKANRSAARISHVCDVDSNILKKFADSTQREMARRLCQTKTFAGFSSRRMWMPSPLPLPTIGTRRWQSRLAGWQTRLCGKAMQPQSAEGEMLVQAQQKYKKLVQMGTQQRSSPHTIEVIEKMNQGIIGRPYFAKAWYSNVRNRALARAIDFLTLLYQALQSTAGR